MQAASTTSANWQELWPYMTEAERAEVMAIANLPAPIWEPHYENIPQQIAYNSTADVIGFGGAAGGGKTDLGIGLALNKHKRSVFFREDSKQLMGITDRLAEILGSRDGYNGQEKVWRNAGPRGVQLEFASLQTMGDEQKHQGRPKDLIVLEEAPNMMEFMCRFVMGWARSADPNQHCQVLLTFNPPTTSDGRWILRFFAPWIDPDYKGERPAPGELRYFATLPDANAKGGFKDMEVPDKRPFVLVGNTRVYDFDPAEYSGAKAVDIIRPLSRTFIPSRVTDNPYLRESGYMSVLQSLPEPLRSQMLKGDFMAGIKDDPWQVVPTYWVDLAVERWKKRNIGDHDRKPEMMAMGIDVARGGDDKTVIVRRHAGWWFDKPLRFPGSATPDGPAVMGQVVAATRDRAPQHIDIIGVGASPYDFLKSARQPVIAIDGRVSVGNTDKSGALTFKNHRSWMWWHVRELLDPANNFGLEIPDDEQLKKDLCTPRWGVTGKVIEVESREDIIKRLGHSPDDGSAFCMACIESPKQLANDMLDNRHSSASQGDYDPYDKAGVRDQSAPAYDPYN